MLDNIVVSLYYFLFSSGVWWFTVLISKLPIVQKFIDFITDENEN